jgi:hypothetical protein
MPFEHLDFSKSVFEIPLSSGSRRTKAKPSETGFMKFQIGTKTAPLQRVGL